MDEPVVALTMGEPELGHLGHPAAATRIRALDCYDVSGAALGRARALLVGMHADQRHLAARRGVLDRFVEDGGRLVVCGQVAIPFVSGLACFEPLRQYGVGDLTVHPLAAHPVWAGVDPDHLLYRRGVAGFYGRGWHQPPAGALVVNGLGPTRLPLDYVYRLGTGDVLVHGGTDLWDYAADPNTTARLLPQLLDWAVS